MPSAASRQLGVHELPRQLNVTKKDERVSFVHIPTTSLVLQVSASCLRLWSL